MGSDGQCGGLMRDVERHVKELLQDFDNHDDGNFLHEGKDQGLCRTTFISSVSENQQSL